MFKAYRALCDVCADKRVSVFCTPEMIKELHFMSNHVDRKEQEAIQKQQPKKAHDDEKEETLEETKEADKESDSSDDE